MQNALAVHVTKLEGLTATLKERNEVLRQAYARAQEANRMKTSFLHHMTNQMIAPSDAINKSVTVLCNQYDDISLKEADYEVKVIQEQSKAIIDLVNSLIHTAENETGKEVTHE